MTNIPNASILQRLQLAMLASVLLCFLVLCAPFGAAWAGNTIVRDLPPGLVIPAAAESGPDFDVDKATRSYLELLSPQQRTLSDQYFEGGYWIQLWEFLWTVGACALLVVTGVSSRLYEFTQRLSRRAWISAPLYIVIFMGALSLLEAPLTLYTDFFREHQYGLSDQSMGSWIQDQLIVLAVNAGLAAIVLTCIYSAVRRAGQRWWLWATGITLAFLLLFQMILPVYILPLLNHYRVLSDGPVKAAVLSLARANQVPTAQVEWFDASKQTTRISANVAGLLGTTRIALNDNLLNKTSLPEIRAVLGHEMGHYVLNHNWTISISLSLLIGLAFSLLNYAMSWTLLRWGTHWKMGGLADPATLPLAIALFSVILFVLMPVQNLLVRSAEAEADAFGLNASREPYGWAMAAMRLSTYRKISPGKFEEFMFYDHPSGYERVHSAMLWLKENQAAPLVK